MSFKNFSLVFILYLILGCSDFINGKRQEDQILKIKNDRFACLNNVPESLRNITNEHSKPEKIEEALLCLESSLTYFKKRTKGTVPDGYSVQDMRSFFGNYLRDRDSVSDEMGTQMMKVKRALFGGSELIIQKKELQDLIDLLAEIRAEVGVLKPYWDVILIKNGINPERDLIEQAHSKFQETLTRIVLKTDLVKSGYTFEDFKSLLNEAEKFVKRAPGNGDVNFIKWVPVLESIKIHLFTDRADMSSVAKWKEALSMSLVLHEVYSLYQYHFKGKELYSRKAFAAADEIIFKAISLVDHSWWMTGDGIPFTETEKLIRALGEQDFLPKNTTAETIIEAYEAFVRNLLERDTYQHEVKLKTLQRKHLATLKNEYRGFKLVQNFNDSMPDQFSYAEMIKSLDQNKNFKVAAFSEISDDLQMHFWRDWNNQLKQVYPMLYLKTGELLLDRNVKKSTDWSWAGLSHLNVMRFINRVLMLSFGTKRLIDLEKESLNELSFTRFYDEFWNYGLKLKAFDARTGNAGKRTFFEADHFVYASDGDGSVSLQESFELVNIVISAGLSGFAQIQNDLSQSSCVLPEKDYFNNPWLDEACFKNILHRHFSIYFKNLPGLTKWVAGLKDADWDAFYKELIGFSRTNQNTVGKIETGDLRTLVVITHYIESMYIKFDRNADDVLSISELVDGSQRFTPFFKKLFELKPIFPIFEQTQQNLYDYAISRAFACMVIAGEMPSITTCTPTFFKNMLKTKPFSNRTRILRTLNVFSESIR